MVLQTLPEAASRYAVEQRYEIGAAVHAVSRLWRGMRDDFDSSYARVEPGEDSGCSGVGGCRGPCKGREAPNPERWDDAF